MRLHTWQSPSSRQPGVLYETVLWEDGSLSCNCRGWTFKRRTAEGQRTCKHVQRYAAEGRAIYRAAGGTVPTAPLPRSVAPPIAPPVVSPPTRPAPRPATPIVDDAPVDAERARYLEL